MKLWKIAVLSIVIGLLMSFSCFAKEMCDGFKNYTPTDYSKKSNWAICDYNNSKKADTDVDVIFLNGTVMQTPDEPTGVANISKDLKNMFNMFYVGAADVFSDGTRMYVPYFRQIALSTALTATSHEDLPYWVSNSEAGADIYAVLDYYFKNYNDGRPFIIAGYSQGGAMVQFALQKYFVEGGRKSLLKRMIGAYSIAYGVDSEWLRNVGLEFANSSNDTGKVISWVTEGPGASEWYLVLPDNPSQNCVINPINWKRDTTYAKAEECLGSYVNGKVVMPGVYNLQYNPYRGVLICDNNTGYVEGIWGGKSLHTYEISQAYLSIRDNMHERIDAYYGIYR